jgi:plasmid stabilization system protein ParE
MHLNFADEAKYDLLSIVIHYTDLGIRKQGMKIRAKIITDALRLKLLPNLGMKSPKATRKFGIECRVLISSDYKIVYHFNVEKKLVTILSVFDTRQSPDKF